jgi:hypothetical protein
MLMIEHNFEVQMQSVYPRKIPAAKISRFAVTMHFITVLKPCVAHHLLAEHVL